jgi:hypothetical protein
MSRKKKKFNPDETASAGGRASHRVNWLFTITVLFLMILGMMAVIVIFG